MANFPPDLVPRAIRQHALFPKVMYTLRLIQLVVAIISLGLFASYIASLIGRISSANGAVIGIIAASVAYTIITTAIVCFVPHGTVLVKVAVWTFDLAFSGAYIGVAVLTAPGRNMSGNMCAMSGDDDDDNDNDTNTMMMGSRKCNLATGTFVLAILSVISYLTSSATGGQSPHSPSKISRPGTKEESG